MADVGRIRMRLPETIKPGDVIHVRALIIHPMERIERDAQGRIVEKKYNYIHRVVVTYQGKTIVAFDTTQSVSENPFFAFALKVNEPGQLRIVFHDTTGATYEGTADVKLS